MEFKSMSKIIIQFVLLLYLSVLISCNQSATCYEPQNIAMRGGLFQYDTDNKLIDTLMNNALIIFGDSTIYYQPIKQNSNFSFPLSQFNNSVSFVFQADSASMASDNFDTIQLAYDRELTFISTACGYQHHFTLKTVNYTQHLIDSVIISTASITNDINKQHLQIVLKN